MKHVVLFIALTLLTCVSCSRSSAPNPAPNAVRAQEDLSLAPADYMNLGFPASDRPWTTPDYQAVFRSMKTLPVSQFPRTTSPKSSPVVDRLTNPDNLGVFANRSLPLDHRFLPCIDLIDAANGITKLYLAAHSRTPLFAEDFMRMQGFMLQAVAVQLGLLSELLPTLDKADPKYPTRMAGLDQARQGMAQMIQGMLIVLEDRNTYPPNSRADFASIIATTFPTIAKDLPPLSRQEFENTLRRITREEKDDAVRAVLSKAIPPE